MRGWVFAFLNWCCWLLMSDENDVGVGFWNQVQVESGGIIFSLS